MNNNANPTTILIIDDEVIIRRSFADYLQDQGYQTLTAENGHVGLEILEHEQPDLVLTDLRMPEVDGLQVVERGSQLAPDTPVLVVSGAGRIGDVIQALRLGAWDYILKPVEDMSVLEHQVKKALEKVRLIRENRMYQENLEALVHDRTAQLEATNAALRESETRFRNLAQNSPDIIYILNLNTKKTIYFNRDNFLGYSMAELERPGSILNTIHPDDAGRVLEHWQQVRKGKASVIEYRLQTQDGRWEWLQSRETILIRNDNGDPAHVLVTLTIVTERKQAEEERENLLVQVQEQAKRIQQTIDTVPEGVILLDTDGRVILTNPVADSDLFLLCGAKVGDAITHLGDRTLAEILTAPPTKGLWHEVKAGTRTFEIIARPMKPAQRQTTDGRLPNGNGPESEDWVVVINDVTQERTIRAQLQQQERLAAVGQLAAGIAHDFNNIMAVIVLYAQVTAQTEGLPARVQERMATINQQAKHATRLIRQILDFSRRSVLERQPLDLLITLKEQCKLLKRTLPENIEINLDYGPDEYGTMFVVNADPTRMQQMITNLAVNARDAMPEGGSLHIRLERVETLPDKSPLLPEIEAEEWVQVTVSDTGMGIPADVLPHMFEPFFTTKGPGLGTGLGLAQVHGIVGAHEGRIDVESQVDQGTTFSIYLPALPVPPVEQPEPELFLREGQGETLLVVEDEIAVREALVEGLQTMNYRTLEAGDGQEALEILERHGDQVALVLSDLIMPGMGGQALFHAIRQRGLTLPVLMLSGHPAENELKELQEQGLAGWMLKPMNMEQLAQLLARALEKQGGFRDGLGWNKI